ncbi:MAG: hypothetical protein M3070_08640 [Actinomycetota bacterium]|nr:hypothetical protein [Actinomycetota bacterium]
MRRAVTLLLCAVTVVGVVGWGLGRAASSVLRSAPQATVGQVASGAGPAARSVVPAGTFLSLVPACACGRYTELDLFSTVAGRRIRRLATVSSTAGELSTSAAADDGDLFMTFTSGPVCAAKGTYAECPGFTPNSCRNTVETRAPGQGTPSRSFTVAGSQAIGEVVPSPDGHSVALAITPCTAVRGTTGLFVRDLKTGATRAVTTSPNRCDGFGPAKWNPAGTELVLPLDRADGPPMPMVGGIGCPAGRSYLALAPTSARRGRAKLKLINPDRGCIFKAAAFDPKGIAAAEGCDHGDPQHGVGVFLGAAYLMQYDKAGHLRKRIRLHLGLEQANVATVPRTGNVLITQDQPADEPYAERDWIWEFDGAHLRPIAHYSANGAAQIIAVPW